MDSLPLSLPYPCLCPARATDFVHIINSVRLLYLICSFNFCLKDMTASNAQRIHEQCSNSARYSSTALPHFSKNKAHTLRLHARSTFTRSIAHEYRTSGRRVISVLRSFFSPPCQHSMIFFLNRIFLLTTNVAEMYVYPSLERVCIPASDRP